MSRIEPADLARIEAAVGAAEARTDAEVVVAIARASGSYRDADLLVGAVAAAAALAAVVYLPGIYVRHGFVLPIACLTYLIAQGIASRVPLTHALLTTPARRARQVDAGARLAFFEESVAATAKRTGVLVYVSLEEGLARILVDTGVRGRVPDETWHALAERIATATVADSLVQGIDEIGRTLAPVLPKSADDTDELSNRPRLR